MSLPTRAAAAALGRSPDYLKRLRDSHGGFLVHGTHYWVGHSSNVPITWDIEWCVRRSLNAAFRHDALSSSEPCRHQFLRGSARVAGERVTATAAGTTPRSFAIRASLMALHRISSAATPSISVASSGPSSALTAVSLAAPGRHRPACRQFRRGAA